MDASRFTLATASKPPKTYPFVTLAEAVTFLALGKFKTSQYLLQVYRKGGYRFSSSRQKLLDAVGANLTTLARDGKVAMVGRRQDAEGAQLEPASPIPRDYFLQGICVDAMRDSIEPDCEIGDNWANPFPRYRYVQIDMRQLEKCYPDGLRQEPSTDASAEVVGLLPASSADDGTEVIGEDVAAQYRDEIGPAKRPTDKQIAVWFGKRVKAWPKGATFPTEREDWEAARSQFPAIKRNQIRTARNGLNVPPEWRKRGPRKNRRDPTP